MLLDRVSNPGPLTYESGALPTALRGPAGMHVLSSQMVTCAQVSHCICRINSIRTMLFVLPHVNFNISPLFNPPVKRP